MENQVLISIAQDANSAKVKIKDKDGEIVLPFDLTMPESYLSPLFSTFVWSGIWKNSVAAIITYLENEFKKNNKNDGPLKMIELGAGLGIPSLYCSLKLDCLQQCVITDRDEDLLFVRRFLSNVNNTVNDSCNKKIRTLSFDWKDEFPLQNEFYDIILCVECVSIKMYGKESLQFLKMAILKVKKKKSSILLLCSEIRKDDGLLEFIEMIKPICITLEQIVMDNGKTCIINALLL